jgi:hypothetical protein
MGLEARNGKHSEVKRRRAGIILRWKLKGSARYRGVTIRRIQIEHIELFGFPGPELHFSVVGMAIDCPIPDGG